MASRSETWLWQAAGFARVVSLHSLVVLRYVHIDGTTYEGEWHSDEKSGRGVETWSDGARYEGEFLHGSKHGVGVYKSGTGVQYEGQFHNDQTLGRGPI